MTILIFLPAYSKASMVPSEEIGSNNLEMAQPDDNQEVLSANLGKLRI